MTSCTSIPVGPSHYSLPAAAVPPSYPRAGTWQAGEVAGHPMPAGGAPRSHVPGPATTATKGDGSGRPSIAAKVNLDDPRVTAASHSRGCHHAGHSPVEVAPARDTAPAPQPAPPVPPAPVARPEA